MSNMEKKSISDKDLNTKVVKEVQKSGPKLSDLNIGVIGAGKLAFSVVSAIIQFTDIDPKNIYISAKSQRNLRRFQAKGCQTSQRNYDIFGYFNCNIVFLCVYGSVINQCYRLGSADKPWPLTVNYIPVPKHTLYILSLISGITLDQIAECLINPKHLNSFPLKMHRIVLNTSVAYGPKAGLAAIDVDPEVLDPIIKELLSKISITEYLSESQMDYFCIICGNGLAISHYLNCVLMNAAIDLNIDKKSALKLSAYAMRSAAQTVLQSGEEPLNLMAKWFPVLSSAQEGIGILEDSQFGSKIANAMQVMSIRAQYLNEFILSEEHKE